MTHEDVNADARLEDVNDVLLNAMPGEADFGQKIAKCQEAFALLNGVEIDGNESEAISADLWIKKPEIFAQILMNQLASSNEANPLAFTLEEKQWWLAVAGYMGPDWLAKLRRVSAFMAKMEEF